MRSSAAVLTSLFVAFVVGNAWADDWEGRIKQAKSADKKMLALDKKYSEQLADWLRSKNPHLQYGALLRFHEGKAALPRKSVSDVAALIDSKQDIYSQRCLEVLRHENHMGQGIIYEQARCRYRHQSIGETAKKLLAKTGGNDPVAALAERIARDPTLESAVTQVLDKMKVVPHAPILAKLAAEKGDESVRGLLAMLLYVRGGGGPRTLPKKLPALMKHSNGRIATRAAMAILVLADDRSKGPRKEATHQLQTALGNAKQLGVAPDISRSTLVAAAVVPALIKRLKNRRAPDDTWVVRALTKAGDAGRSALPIIIRRIKNFGTDDCPKDDLAYVTALGPLGRGAKSAILRTVSKKHTYCLAAATKALAGTGVRLSTGEWRRIYDVYTRACEDAGSIPFFSLSHDDTCVSIAENLEKVAGRSGRKFREVGWDG